MKKLLVLLMLMLLPAVALAADPAVPADAALVAVLVPDYELVEGNISRDGDEMRLLMRRPDGMLVFVGGLHDAEQGWQMTESTPLPEGTVIGVENFVYSLGIGGQLVSVKPYANGTWGVSLFYPGEDGLFRVGPNWVEDEQNELHIGDHPWGDLTRIDWFSLPNSREDALAQLDQTHWATPNNPNPADRLNLRAQPDKKSASLGKYYNGAPIRVLEKQGEWTRVDVLGVQGWMMSAYLSQSEVEEAMPELQTVEGGASLYAEPAQDALIRTGVAGSADMKVIGIVNEAYYHVWFYEAGYSGYIPVDQLWPGNG